MGRFGTGFGLNKYNASLWGGGTEIFNANVANLNGVNQYLNGGDNLDPRTNKCLSWGFWTKEITDRQFISKINSAGGYGNPNGFQIEVYSNQVGFLFYDADGNTGSAGVAYYYLNHTLDVTDEIFWTVTYNRQTFYAELFADGVSLGQIPDVGGTGLDATSYLNDINTAWDLRIARDANTGVTYGTGELHGLSFSYGTEVLSQTDISNLYNESKMPCKDIIPTETRDKMTEYFYLANWDGNTGQELIGKLGGITLTNVNNVPFTGSAQIECEA